MPDDSKTDEYWFYLRNPSVKHSRSQNSHRADAAAPRRLSGDALPDVRFSRRQGVGPFVA